MKILKQDGMKLCLGIDHKEVEIIKDKNTYAVAIGEREKGFLINEMVYDKLGIYTSLERAKEVLVEMTKTSDDFFIMPPK